MDGEPLTIGRILRPHGNRGDVRVLPLTDFPDRFLDLDRVFVGDRESYDRYEVAEASVHGRVVLVRFSGVESRDSAERLRGLSIMIPESERVELPADHYFVYELVGIDCYKLDGSLVGKVTDVLQTGANDVYVVEGSGRTHLVPGVKAVVKEIDLETRRMVVDWLDGM